METKRYFKNYLETAFDNGEFSTDDVIAFILPLIREVISFHEDGKVAPFEHDDALFIMDDRLDIDENLIHPPLHANDTLAKLSARLKSEHFDIVGNLRMDTDVDEGTQKVENLQLHLDPGKPLTSPAYIPGYGCFEIRVGHHDEQTDIFCIGLLLGSIAMALDLYDENDLEIFVSNRATPARYNPRIHPALSRLISEMTELDRSKRTQDLYDVVNQLENYRDFDPEKQVDLSHLTGWKNRELSGRGQYILGKLRNRLFDTSRRNRLLYYKPNMRFVNLTVSSVPMVLHYQSIRPELLFTWNAEIAGRVKDMKDIVLNKYLRFEDHQYLTSSLDKIRSEARHDMQEFGFSQLKLVIAFLNWHNLKEDRNERIQSPLLLIPVELKKNKKLKEDHYVLQVLANEAEVNPVLANQLRELYGLRLPDFIDLDETTLEAFYKNVKDQVDHANQGITLTYVDKPKIKLVHSIARQTVGNYKRRLRRSGNMDSYRNLSYSYQADQFKPLGLEIFRQYIQPRASLLEFLVNDEIKIASHNLTGTRERELFEMAESEHNPYNWDFDICNVVLGNFNYKKMSLVRDYNKVVDSNIHHTVFENLFDDKPRDVQPENRERNDPSSWYHVITADPTQTNAILQSRTGRSYIVQGPPGTGKSQTITNLIADFLGQGKNVLFVCEKRAALDVVYHRLKQQELDELCCYIHDSQGDKRDFIRNLKETYERFIQERMDLERIKADRDDVLQKLKNHLGVPGRYHTVNTTPGAETGIEPIRLIGRLVELKKKLVALGAREEELLPHYNEWQGAAEVIKELSHSLEETGAEPFLAGHPFRLVRETLFDSESPVTVITGLIRTAEELIDGIAAIYSEFRVDGSIGTDMKSMRDLFEDAVLLHPLAEADNIHIADPSHPSAREFDEAYRAYVDITGRWQAAKEKNANWVQKFSRQDAANGLETANAKEASFFRFLNGAWKDLKKSIDAAYNFSKHAVKPKYAELLTNLLTEYDLADEATRSRQQLESRFHLQEIDSSWIAIERIRNKKGDREVDFLLRHPDARVLIRRLHKANTLFWQLEATLKELLLDVETKNMAELKDDLQNISANLDSLPGLLPALRKYAVASPRVRKAIRELSLEPGSFEAAMVNKSLKHTYAREKEFHQCDGNYIEKSVSAIEKCYHQLLKLNAGLIRATVRNRFIEHLELSNMAISQLDPGQRNFKKNYTEGRKILENEFGKSMRYKSIRELAARESGLVLKDLKPVWLMSPLSVSDSLPIDATTFDVVIFDEASQITLEEGIPSLYRAPQTIIVGDDKQMPPTNFFSARSEDPDDLEQYQEDEDEWLSHDADSLLVQGTRKLHSVMLGWHYRSRYETLISYSNHAFYDANLLTIPDRVIHGREKTAIEVTAATDASRFADALFDRSISFHFQANSSYEKRANTGEAEYIAHLVRELLLRKTTESIGIVAFSQEQQHTIEEALTELAATDKVFEQLLEEAYTRTEDDQYVGLIIKNLENIQGDERDIIIMSVCYGHDSRKRMIMNFGPINKKGGEKRLNVIFSRAKKHMAVVSSIRHHNITNEYNEGANYFKRFLHYAEQVSSGNMTMARTVLDSLVAKKEQHTKDKVSLVAREIREALEQLGYETGENVGQSGFKCSVAVKMKNEEDSYSLAILVDDERHYANPDVMEQYVQRPAILDGFGWKTITVFAKDWLHAPQEVLDRIRKRMVEGKTSPEEIILPDYIKAVPSSPALENRSSQTAAGLYDDLLFTRLVYTDENSNKFWEAAVTAAKLVIRFGRIGTRGQTQVKTFDSSEAAAAEMAKMIREKEGKGYARS